VVAAGAAAVLDTTLGPVLAEPHHDGSPRYVSTDRPSLGDQVRVRVRVPDGIGIDRLHIRIVRDAEPLFVALRAEPPDPQAATGETWWAVDVEVHNPVTSYRFLTDGPAGYGWLNATGWHHERDVLDVGDFLISAHPGPPPWAQDAIVLQIFPDRFARSPDAGARPAPQWAEVSAWDEPVAKKRGEYAFQLYGGDLEGIVAHLDHIQRLSVTVLYLTPFFPAGSAHRYDASSFETVDPLLGGDAALAHLVEAAHARGIRVIGDLTTNHTGRGHEWFQHARADAGAPEASYYFFTDHPNGYVGWLGHRSLPKLDWRSEPLREAFLRGPDSIVGRWLRPPADLDGWRIDVANMTGRYREHDLAHEVAEEIRATMRQVRPDGWLIAEHAHAAGPDLLGSGWHGTMNYAGFTRPVWTWLAAPGALSGRGFLGVPTGDGVPILGGHAVVAAMREAWSTMPWRSLTAGMNALDTHDTARFLTVVGGNEGKYAAGLALLFTMPGAPMVFAGAESGIGGEDGELSRVPIPWDRPEAWDLRVLTLHEELAALRRSSVALRRGGLRWVDVQDDSMTFEREAPDSSERILVHVARAPHAQVSLPGAWFAQAEALFGAELPRRTDDGGWALPADGPGAHVWRVR
jgi:alpha-glucosidase